MNNFKNMRQWSERVMSPASFGLGRQNPGGPVINGMNKQMPNVPQASDGFIFYVFNVPFSPDLAGPNVEEILHSTADAVLRWTHPEEAPASVPVWDLPVHAQNMGHLLKICGELTAGPLPIEAQVHKMVTDKNELKTTVVLSGSAEIVHKSRETIMNDLPLSIRCITVDIDLRHICDLQKSEIKPEFTDGLDMISAITGTDIFLLGPKPTEDCFTTDLGGRVDKRWRVAIYGDIDSSESARTRVLVQIDKMLGRFVESFVLESHMHLLSCGRHKKNINQVESNTGCAIYFPAPFSHVSRYVPQNAQVRPIDEIIITGDSKNAILTARQNLRALAQQARMYVKDVPISASKIDSMILTRLSKIRKILDSHGTYLIWPPLATQRSQIRVNGADGTWVERTIKDIMSLAGQFYSATWWIQHLDPRHIGASNDLCGMLGDVCAKSNADILFEKSSFTLTGFDDAVKTGLHILSEMAFFTQTQYQIKVKIELANEHKEFVSGKKNGKINKIMGQSNVQILFDGFNEYNFNIDVNAGSYVQLKHGLNLVEAEMPASISFHVPDQYHKRIIGIGGQHIQRIMKKHSVFVKFSNAMDRGGPRDDDDIKADNVICRTPARNAQNLELVKTEILDMVDQEDQELTTQEVNVDRLFHRQLKARLLEIEDLEKQWKCKLVFPSTEQASDMITVTGPEWQVPHFVDAFLGMVPDSHELVVPDTPKLSEFLQSPHFAEMRQHLHCHYEVDISLRCDAEEDSEEGAATITFVCAFTRNNAGAIRDAQDYLQSEFAVANLEVTFIKGCIPRPQSNTFSEALPFFESKLLQPTATQPPESPAKSAFGDEVVRERSTLLDRLRKPGSMSSISSFLDRRKNSSQSTVSFFKGSANVSKTSLISIESTRSFNADRNPWNDSGVNLGDEDGNMWLTRPFSNGSGSGASGASANSNGNGNNNPNIHSGLSNHSMPAMPTLPSIHSSPTNPNNPNNPTNLNNANPNNLVSGVAAMNLDPMKINHGMNPPMCPTTPGDATPRHNARPSVDSGRPSTSHSTHSGYPGAFGPFH